MKSNKLVLNAKQKNTDAGIFPISLAIFSININYIKKIWRREREERERQRGGERMEERREGGKREELPCCFMIAAAANVFFFSIRSLRVILALI